MMTNPRLVSLHGFADDVRKLARLRFLPDRLADQQFAWTAAFDEVSPQSLGSRQQSALDFVENECNSVVTA